MRSKPISPEPLLDWAPMSVPDSDWVEDAPISVTAGYGSSADAEAAIPAPAPARSRLAPPRLAPTQLVAAGQVPGGNLAAAAARGAQLVQPGLGGGADLQVLNDAYMRLMGRPLPRDKWTLFNQLDDPVHGLMPHELDDPIPRISETSPQNLDKVRWDLWTTL